jgi:lysyl-tRNA synthetase class 2
VRTEPRFTTVEGRVFAADVDNALIGDAFSRRRIDLPRDAPALREGDLVRAECESVDGALVARSVELVFRPSASPFAARSETARMVASGVAQRLRARQAILTRLRRHFVDRGFLEVETPSIVRCPGLDLHLAAFDARDTRDGERLGYLITSPEYHMKRLVVGGVSRCFQFARCYRAGEIGGRHEPEFTMLEWYRAWARFDHLLEDTEDVIRAALADDLEAPPRFRAPSGATIALDRRFDRCTVREAFARYAPFVRDPIALADRDEPEYFRILSERVEPALGRERPTFLTHFAARHASLSALDPEDPSVCLRAELYIDGIELSNGFVELTDPREQRERFERDRAERRARALPDYPLDEDFLRALEEGMPPTVGNAMGLDRLVALALGSADIADVVAFSHRRAVEGS